MDNIKTAHSTRAIRLPELVNISGISRSSLWRKVKTDPAFPKPFKLSEGITVWDEAEVREWIEAKKSMRGAA